MSPQPFSNPEFRGFDVVLNPKAVTMLAHETLRMGMEIVARWTYLESAIMSLLATAMSADSVAVAALLSGVKAPGLRHNLVKRAGEACLEGRDRVYFANLLDRVQQDSRIRNKVSHCPWLACSQLPDHLLLLDSGHEDAISKRHASVIELMVSGEWRERLFDGPTPSIDRSHIKVYRPAEIQDALSHLVQTFYLTRILIGHLAPYEVVGMSELVRDRLEDALG